MKQRLSLRQRAFIACYVDGGGNATAAVKKAGYKVKNDRVAAQVGYENLRKPEIRAAIKASLDAQGLTPEHASLKLYEALHATKTVFFAHRGRVVSEREVVNWDARVDALDMLHKILGRYKTRLEGPADCPMAVIYLPASGIALPSVMVGGASDGLDRRLGG